MKRKHLQQIAVAASAVLAVTGSMAPLSVCADEPFYQSREAVTSYAGETGSSEEDVLGVVQTAAGVTEEMCLPSYWFSKNTGSPFKSGDLLINKDEIQKLNREMLGTKGAYMNDLESMDETYDADSLRSALASSIKPPNKPALYANGELISDNSAYYGNLADMVLDSGYTGSERTVQYSVITKRTTMKSIPTSDYIGYSATDADDEIVDTALNVGEPFVIKQKAGVSGNDFYWGYCDHCTGWVAAEDLAICSDREEWLDAWRIDPASTDFVVVKQNQIVLDPSVFTPCSSEVKLTFSTILKTVPEDEIPRSIGERGSWNNHVVYLPTRDEEGRYVKRIALIAQHYDVSEGFLPLTQENLLDTAFGCLGDRYGWGGMLDAMDCSLYTRNVYKCFGLFLPRNTSWQQLIPGRLFSFADMTEAEKLNAIRHMPAGTLFYFPGHTMIYTGMDEGMAYVISDTGSLSDSIGDVDVRSMYSVLLNPLTVRRRAGTTWLENLTAAVLPFSESSFASVMEYISENKEQQEKTEPGIIQPGYVLPLSGQTFASSSDTLALDTFTGSSKELYIDFSNVPSDVSLPLTVTCIKGTRISTKAPVISAACDKKAVKVQLNKNNSHARLTMKRSATVSFNMADGRTYAVRFNVESPKPQKSLSRFDPGSVSQNTVSGLCLTPASLFGTTIDGGSLEIVKAKSDSAVIKDNCLVFDPAVKNSIKLCYRYLDKKYSMTVSVR